MEVLAAGPNEGMLFATFDGPTNAEGALLEGGVARQAALGDYIFGLFGTSIALIFWLLDDGPTFIVPMVLV